MEVAAYCLTPKSVQIPFRFGDAVTASLGMGRLFARLASVASSEFTILLQGETGTGKDILARSIHRASARCERPMVTVDCGSLPPALVESELFGHAKGAFTGATNERMGAFLEARGGTLFLDEIGELPLEVQPRLLRVLETGTVKRVGEDQYRELSVRVIAATHRDLQHQVAEKRFREDLFFRLAVLPFRIPALRERKEDIAVLVDIFLQQMGRPDITLRDSVKEELLCHDWPGNVRELRNSVSRLVAGHDLVLDLPTTTSSSGSLSAQRGQQRQSSDEQWCADGPDSRTPFKQAKDALLNRFTCAYLKDLEQREGGNLARMARAAGISRNHLRDLIERSRAVEE